MVEFTKPLILDLCCCFKSSTSVEGLMHTSKEGKRTKPKHHITSHPTIHPFFHPQATKHLLLRVIYYNTQQFITLLLSKSI